MKNMKKAGSRIYKQLFYAEFRFIKNEVIMIKFKEYFFNLISLLCCSFLFVYALHGTSDAAISASSSKMIVDSDEPFNCRVYSYDMDIDSRGNVHIVYSKPNADCTKAGIYYVRRVAGNWQGPNLITADGLRPSISTLLLVDRNDRVHVCYIEDGTDSLHYVSIQDGNIDKDITVDNGGWHTRMQLDGNDYPIFIRENGTSMAILTTQNGATWGKKNLNLPPVKWYRIADFVYADGTYHITYGDSAYTFEVWDGKVMTERIFDTFHNLHYATSSDGQVWSETTVDSSGTLYKMQFWTAMVLDRGNPLISMYKFNEYKDRYNFGTSANLMTKNKGVWENRIITNREHLDTLEGMGVGLAVNESGDYFAVWDFSPPDTYDDNFRGIDGNIALARNGPKNDWTPKVQLDPFSLEGRAVLRIHGGKLFFLGLGNWRDAKLYFREYDISYLDMVLSPDDGSQSPPFGGGNGTVLPSVYNLLIEK